MILNKERYTFAIILAVMLHLIILGFFLFNKQSSQNKLGTQQAPVNIVQARVVNANGLLQKVSPVQAAVQKPKPAKQAQENLEKKTHLSKGLNVQNELPLEKAVVQEKTKVLPLVKKPKQEEEQTQHLLAAQEKKHQQELKREAVRLQKKLEQQRLAKELLAEQKKIAEKLAKDAKNHQELAAKQAKENAEKELQAQLKAEHDALANEAQAVQIQGEVDKYKALVLEAIRQQWIIPETSKNLSCKLLIRLAAGGMVLDATVINTSGDDALDRSAIAAVYKASPLPVPTEPMVFDQFRELHLTVKPE